MSDYTSLDGDEIIRIGDDLYQVAQSKDTNEYIIEKLDTEYCDVCEENTLDKECEQCGHDKRKPTMGGYDPELDYDG